MQGLSPGARYDKPQIILRKTSDFSPHISNFMEFMGNVMFIKNYVVLHYIFK